MLQVRQLANLPHALPTTTTPIKKSRKPKNKKSTCTKALSTVRMCVEEGGETVLSVNALTLPDGTALR